MEIPPLEVSFTISIHALREEGDDTIYTCKKALANFYPRPPRGGRQGNTAAFSVTSIFLSTPSARRATDPEISGAQGGGISIHALREEGDFRLIR